MMTLVVTRDVEPRVRGFLASCMLELAPGVYTCPGMTRAVRERVWGVLTDWHTSTGGVILMTWPERKAPGGQEVLTLGWPARVLVEAGEVILSHRDLTLEDEDRLRSLTSRLKSGSGEGS